MMRREDIDAVVAPSAIAGEFDHRHQLDVSDAEIGEMAETIDRGIESPGGRESANVHFVHDR